MFSMSQETLNIMDSSGRLASGLGGKSSWILGEGPETLPALSCEGRPAVHKPSCQDVSQPGPACTQRIAMHGRDTARLLNPD